MADEKQNEMMIFKIRRRSDGLFSTGGERPSFTKKGKIWKTKGHLTSHLRLVDMRPIMRGHNVYTDCEVVLFRLVETQIDKVGLTSWINEIENKKQKKEEEYKAHINKRNKEERKKKYLELKEEFGS